MKKIGLMLLIISVLMILTSCAEVMVTYKLTEENNMDISYSVRLEPDGLDVSAYIDQAQEYWNSMGFETVASEDKSAYLLSGEKMIAGDSRQAASSEFSSVVTDEDSFFYDVSFIYTPSYEQDTYKFNAKVSLADIIRQDQVYDFPTNEINSFIEDAYAGNYTLALSFPGDIIATNADETKGKICIWHLKYGEAKEIKLETRLVNSENIKKYADLNETFQSDQQYFIIFGSIAAALLAILIIYTIIRRIKKSKH